MNYKSISELANHIKELKDRNRETVVFIGAGMSQSAGIPITNGISDGKDYYEYMQDLSPGKRASIFRKYNNQSKVNTAYLFLAYLIKKGYVRNVLTTNFDNLLIRSLSLFHIYPSIYDLSISKNNILDIDFDSNAPAIFYLHGQIGTYPKNLQKDLDEIKPSISKLFQQFNKNCWVVVGYSGKDPVINCFQEIETYWENLYWVQYLKEKPNENVINKLFANRENTYLIENYDADSFFIDLRRELSLELPDIIAKPFSFLSGVIDSFKPITKTYTDDNIKQEYYTIESKKQTVDFLLPIKKQVELSINVFEEENFVKNIEELNNQIRTNKNQNILSAISWTKSFEDLKDIEDVISLKDSDDTARIQYSKLLSEYGCNIMSEVNNKYSTEKLYKAQELFGKANQIYRSADYLSNYGITFAYIAESNQVFEESEILYLKSFEILQDAYKEGEHNDLALINYCRAIHSYILKINNNGLSEKIDIIEKYLQIGLETFEFIENKWINTHATIPIESLIYYSELNYEWSRFLLTYARFEQENKIEFLELSKVRAENVLRKNEIENALQLLEKIDNEISKLK
jgi:hypothetical protein